MRVDVSKSLFSIVIPVYYNELNLPQTIPELLRLGEALPGYALELVFVDDGSGDRSLEVLLSWRDRYPETIRVVKLTRNFGSMAAILAGLGVARGACVGVITADLQDPPELFAAMISHWEKGVKAVFAVREGREEPVLQKWFAGIYYRMLSRYALPGYPRGGFDFLLIDRQVVEEVIRVREKNTNLMSLIYWMGFGHVMIPYTRKERQLGVSRWTFSKKVKLFIDSFVAFSYMPIRFLSALGLLIATGSFVCGAFIVVAWLTNSIEVKGYTPIMILLTLTAGIQMTMLGILGEYLWRALDETRRRPPFVIDHTYGE
jgi:glycosyltransferase involved in cell wall biosynthesis